MWKDSNISIKDIKVKMSEIMSCSILSMVTYVGKQICSFDYDLLIPKFGTISGCKQLKSHLQINMLFFELVGTTPYDVFSMNYVSFLLDFHDPFILLEMLEGFLLDFLAIF